MAVVQTSPTKSVCLLAPPPSQSLQGLGETQLDVPLQRPPRSQPLYLSRPMSIGRLELVTTPSCSEDGQYNDRGNGTHGSSTSSEPRRRSVAQKGVPRCRLASSRGWTSNHQSSRTSPPKSRRSIPGEYLELESDEVQPRRLSLQITRASNSPRRQEGGERASSREPAWDDAGSLMSGFRENIRRARSSRVRFSQLSNSSSHLTAQSPVSPLESRQQVPVNSQKRTSDVSLPSRIPRPSTPGIESISPLDAPEPSAAPAQTTVLPNERFRCVICNDSKFLTDLPVHCLTHHTHPLNTCLYCLQDWIASCLDNRGWQRITCPECNELLSYEDIQGAAAPGVFTRYNTLTTRATLSAIPNFRWCRSPTCDSGQIHEGSGDDNPIFTCNACRYTHCINHPNVQYHRGETCEQYEARVDPQSSSRQARQERMSEKIIQDTTKQCPNPICGWHIEKNDGCDHMTCSKCLFEFCWLCSAPYRPIRERGNREHKPGCRYYT